MSTGNLPPTGQKPTAGSRVADKLAKPKVALGIIITALAIWFIAINNATVRIHFWVAWVSAKLWIVLLLVFVLGALASYLLSWRRSRRARRQM
ncbi:LapA family protein [Actinospica robiniae]|uniref:LapA family protein n=1 Tax=Actinospica robiniae TaxID=304901 RepID=UPI0003F7D46E|nr:LapA family protein [Actinospica robiniae]